MASLVRLKLPRQRINGITYGRLIIVPRHGGDMDNHTTTGFFWGSPADPPLNDITSVVTTTHLSVAKVLNLIPLNNPEPITIGLQTAGRLTVIGCIAKTDTHLKSPHFPRVCQVQDELISPPRFIGITQVF